MEDFGILKAAISSAEVFQNIVVSYNRRKARKYRSSAR